MTAMHTGDYVIKITLSVPGSDPHYHQCDAQNTRHTGCIKSLSKGNNLMSKVIINTAQAPAAIGTYSQAVKLGTTVYLSGQIPLSPVSMQLVSEEFCRTGRAGLSEFERLLLSGRWRAV